MISSLTLTNFRNHVSSRINIGACQNVIITGPNGAGKTAILEAVSMMSGDRGIRGVPYNEIARFNGDGGFSAYADLVDDTSVAVFFTKGDTNRRAKIQGDNASLSDLGQHLRIVWLTPREDRLFVDSAGERRAFFDRLVASFDAKHSGRVARLGKLLSERGFALKSGSDTNWINALDVQIAEISIAIAAARIQYAAEVNYFLENAAVSVSGLVENYLLQGNAGDAQKLYLGYLHSNRELSGDKMILDGVHKSDFGVFNKLLKLPVSLTSTGQQKSILIDLILAHAKLVRTKTGKIPLILLDEAVAHLDSSARNRVFSELAGTGAQVWASGLEIEVFKDIPNSLFVTCQNGAINSIVEL